MNQEATWIKEQKENTMFRGTNTEQVAAKRMLEISKTNRIVNLRFARLAIGVRLLSVCLGEKYKELEDLVDMCEAYQLTVGDPKNSREAFLEAIKAQFAHYVHTGDKKGNII